MHSVMPRSRAVYTVTEPSDGGMGVQVTVSTAEALEAPAPPKPLKRQQTTAERLDKVGGLAHAPLCMFA